ncbi:sensor histidine kinase [Oceaniferula spumae]|uniref:histidine kinase n=1 Tax=Oceaniferula spumae TaxID=2979115 RepID=A0AAT9FNU3_9BACT
MRLTRVTLFLLVLIIGFGFYRLAVYLLDDVDAQTFQATEEVMVDTATVLAGVVEEKIANGASKPDVQSLRQVFDHAQRHQIEAKIYNHTKTNLGINTYITDSTGLVIFDSDEGKREGRNMADFNDIARTLAGRYGARSSREDENDPNSSVLFVASPIRSGDNIIGVLTVYKPQADVRTFITGRRRDILTATLLIGGGIILLVVAVFVWVFQPLGKLTNYAQAISRGERRPLPNLGKGKEVNTLGKALRDMRETLEGRDYVKNYISTLTHELKSPLAAIRGAAELLEEDMPAKQRHRFLDNIRRETSRSESLVRDLVQLSELEGQSHLENHRPFNLTELCHEIADEAGPRLAVKGLQLEFSSDEDINLTGDAMVIKLAIKNLLENAISFSPDKGTINLTLESKDKKSVISLKDEGPGAPDYALERAFEHFYSLPRPGSDRKGTGLGLPLVYEAAKLHGGTAELKNLPERGCVASIHLPL